MATEEQVKDIGGVSPANQGLEANHEEGELQIKIKELEKKVSTLTSDNTRLKNELRFTMEHQRRMSDEQIESLQRDIEVLASRNDQLSSDLMTTEADLYSVKQAKIQADTEYSTDMATQSTAIVEKLSSAHHAREKELLTQLNTALEREEKALRKLSEMGIDTGDSDQPRESSDLMDKGLEDQMKSLRSAKDVLELQKSGSLLVKKVAKLREENQRKILEQINMLKQESEAARSKKLALENEIERLRRKLEMMETEFKLVDRQRVKTLQTQLQAALIEKEQWEKRANKFEDTCETLRVISSLQKSLSKEDDIKHKYERELQRCHTEKLVLTSQLERALQERNICVKERNDVIRERNALALQAQQEYERAERFQRLVVVLRKKAVLSSAGSARSPVNPAYEV